MIDRRTLMTAAASSAVFPGRADTIRTEWHDGSRRRAIPVLIRRPAAPGPAPLVLLSHGLGGSREGLAYLGQVLAEAGYAAVHLQHRGSDTAVWQGAADPRAAFASAAMNVGAALARLQDVAFALDHLARGDEPALRERIDAAQVAIAGHSYGAWTVSHMLGERLPLGAWGLTLPDRRLKAGIALSPIPPLGVSPEVAYDRISAPMLHVTGTQDHGMAVSDWRLRTQGYRNARAPAVLAVLAGARHAAFAGEAEIGGYWNDPAYQPRTARLALLFLDAVLRGNGTARTALLGGDGLGPADVIESKGFA